MESYFDPKYLERRKQARRGMAGVEDEAAKMRVLYGNPFYGMNLPTVPLQANNPAIEALARPPGTTGPPLLAEAAQAYGDSIRNFVPLAQQAYQSAGEGFASTSPVPTIASNPGVGMAQDALQGLSLPSFEKPKVLEEMEAVGAALNPPINMTPDSQALGRAARSVAGSITPESLAIVPGLPSKEAFARDVGYNLRGGPLDTAAQTVGYMEEEGKYIGSEILRALGQTGMGKAFKEGYYGPPPTFGGLEGGASSAPEVTPEMAQAQAKAQEQDLASSVVGLGGGGGGGGVNPNIVGSGGGYGNLYGLEEPKPLPRPDFSRIDELLAQLQPTPPEKTSREDMLLAVLGGLASGSLAGNTAGAALAGAGAGGIGARDQMLQRERFDQKEFEKETRSFFMQQAQQEMNELQMNGQLDLQDAAARRDFIHQRANILQQQEALRIQVQLHNSAQAGADRRASSKSGIEGLGKIGNIPINGTSMPFALAMATDPVATMNFVRSKLRGDPEAVALTSLANEILAGNESARTQMSMDPKARAYLDSAINQKAGILIANGWDGVVTPAIRDWFTRELSLMYPSE
jgi:hypothetical protein